MLIPPAYAEAATTTAADPGSNVLIQMLPILVLFGAMYFLILRPQQKRVKAHQEMIKNLKRNDVVVVGGGFIGKVRQIDDAELRVEIAPNVEVRVLRSSVYEVRTKGDPAPANDAKSS